MTPDERAEVERLKQRVKVLERKSARRATVEARILDHARQYARLVTMQYMTDPRNGERLGYSDADARYHAEMFVDHIKAEAVELLREETT